MEKLSGYGSLTHGLGSKDDTSTVVTDNFTPENLNIFNQIFALQKKHNVNGDPNDANVNMEHIRRNIDFKTSEIMERVNEMKQHHQGKKVKKKKIETK